MKEGATRAQALIRKDEVHGPEPSDSALNLAIRDVRNEQSSTRYCIVGHRGSVKRLGLITTGTGGVTELCEHLAQAPSELLHCLFSSRNGVQLARLDWVGTDVDAVARSVTLAAQADALGRLFGYCHHKFFCDDGDVEKLAAEISGTGVYEAAGVNAYDKFGDGHYELLRLQREREAGGDGGESALVDQMQELHSELQRAQNRERAFVTAMERARETEASLLAEIDRIKNEKVGGNTASERALVSAIEQEAAGARALQLEIQELSPRAQDHGRLVQELSKERQANQELRHELALCQADMRLQKEEFDARIRELKGDEQPQPVMVRLYSPEPGKVKLRPVAQDGLEVAGQEPPP